MARIPGVDLGARVLVISVLALALGACSKDEPKEASRASKETPASLVAKAKDSMGRAQKSAAKSAPKPAEPPAATIEEQKARFQARAARRIEGLTKRLASTDANAKDLSAEAAATWAKTRPALQAKLDAAKQDLESFKAAVPADAMAQYRPKIRAAFRDIGAALDSIKVGNRGAAPKPAEGATSGA